MTEPVHDHEAKSGLRAYLRPSSRGRIENSASAASMTSRVVSGRVELTERTGAVLSCAIGLLTATGRGVQLVGVPGGSGHAMAIGRATCTGMDWGRPTAIPLAW